MPGFAVEGLDQDQAMILFHRQQTWPDWQLSGSIYRSGLREDLFYPKWFEGFWEIESRDLSDPEQLILHHFGSFHPDLKHRIIGDRAFNVESLAKALLGEKLLKVVDDPISPNRQLAFLKGGFFLETTVIGRSQGEDPLRGFFADEFIFADHSLTFRNKD